MNFNNVRISAKLIAAFVVILSVFALASGAVFLSLNATVKAAEQNNVSNENIRDVTAVLNYAVEQQNAARGFAATRNADFLTNVEKNRGLLYKHLDDFTARTTRPEQKERAARLKAALNAWEGKNDEIITLSRDPATEFQALAKLDEVRLTEIRAVQGEIMEAQNKLVAERWQAQQDAIGQAKMTLIFGSLVAMLAAAAMAWLLSRSIAAPVGAMTRVMGKLAGGDNAVDVPALGRKD